jgi:nucleoside-diphosphate-sugar epimerase
MRLLVTGANGFLGSALSSTLVDRARDEVFGFFRTAPAATGKSPHLTALIGSLDPNENWDAIPRASDALIHTAARVHQMRDTASDPLVEYRRINVAGTLNLARRAAALGLRRFIFISTLKVNGESTGTGKSYSADDTPAPLDPYGVSKWEAEQGLREIALQTGMEVVIIRPPLIYGPGVKGNFKTMVQWLNLGIPLPLGAILNQRSFVNLDNLVDLIVTCIDHPAAANQTFLASDGVDLSTPELLRRMAGALGKTVRLIAVPPWLLKIAGATLGKREAVHRLCDSLCADITKTRRMLDWSPIASVDDGLRKTAQSLLREASV